MEPYRVPTRPTVAPASTIAPPSTKAVLADVMNGFPHSSTDRFLSPYHKEELDHLCRPFLPDRTQSKNNWATHVYKTWEATRNQMSPDGILPADLFEVRYPLDIKDRTLQHLSWRPNELTEHPQEHHCSTFWVMKANQGALNVVSFVEKYFPRYHNALDCALRAL